MVFDLILYPKKLHWLQNDFHERTVQHFIYHLSQQYTYLFLNRYVQKEQLIVCLEGKLAALDHHYSICTSCCFCFIFCSLREHDHPSAHKLPYRSYSLYIKQFLSKGGNGAELIMPGSPSFLGVIFLLINSLHMCFNDRGFPGKVHKQDHHELHYIRLLDNALFSCFTCTYVHIVAVIVLVIHLKCHKFLAILYASPEPFSVLNRLRHSQRSPEEPAQLLLHTAPATRH